MFLAYLPFLFWLFQLEQQNPLTVPVQTFQREHHTAVRFPASQLEQNTKTKLVLLEEGCACEELYCSRLAQDRDSIQTTETSVYLQKQ